MTRDGESRNPLTRPLAIALGAVLASTMAFFGFSAGQAAVVSDPTASGSTLTTTTIGPAGTTSGATAPSVSAGTSQSSNAGSNGS